MMACCWCRLIHPATRAMMTCRIMAVPQVGVVVRIALSYSQPGEYQCSSVGQIFQQYAISGCRSVVKQVFESRSVVCLERIFGDVAFCHVDNLTMALDLKPRLRGPGDPVRVLDAQLPTRVRPGDLSLACKSF